MAEFKRAYFRLEMKNASVSIQLVSSHSSVSLNQGRTIEGKIKDISGGGMSFVADKLKFQKEQPISVKLFFRVGSSKFDIKATVLREEEWEGRYLYGCKFEEMEHVERSMLTTLLLNIDLLERKERLQQLLQQRLKRTAERNG